MSKIRTLKEIRQLPEVNNDEMASQNEVQANTDTVDLTPLIDEYLATARARRALRRLSRSPSGLEST